MRVLVCGSRTWKARAAVEVVLEGLLVRYGVITIIEGCAPKGADLFAHEFLRSNVVHRHYPADWNAPCRETCRQGHRRRRGDSTYCPTAGNYRNQLMLDDAQPELVVAFTEQPRTSGTNDMVCRAKIAGVPTWVLGHG